MSDHTLPGTSVSPSIAETTWYGDAVEVLTPTSYDEIADVLRDQRDRGRTVIPSGLGQHAYFGNRIEGPAVVLSLREFKSILRYEPGDFTVGAQAGIPFDELRSELASHGQEVPVDIATGEYGFTLGGAVASNIYGPRSGLYGTLRNFVIGAVAMRGDGSLYKTGGMVVKNVAGYDIAKLLLGSLGTLGIILEVNFKLRPIRQRRSGSVTTFSLPSEAWEFVRRVRKEHLDPVVLSVLDPQASSALIKSVLDTDNDSWTVLWMFEGNDGAVSSLDTTMDDILDDTPVNERHVLDDDALGAALEHLVRLQIPQNPAAEDQFIVRLSALPTVAGRLTDRWQNIVEDVNGVRLEGTVAYAASGVIVAQARGTVDALGECTQRLSKALREMDATGRVLFAGTRLRDSQSYLLGPDPNTRIMRAVQKVFDPHAFFHANRISQLNAP